MRIAFINPDASHAYDSATVRQRPLAGSETAQVHLALEMARRGHDVALVTGMVQGRSDNGLREMPLPEDRGRLGGFDAYLVTNAPGFAAELRGALGPDPLIVTWLHNTPSPDPLAATMMRALDAARDRVLFVSAWQREQFILAYHLDPDRLKIVGNAVAPAFLGLFEASGLRRMKAGPPVMVFTGAPHKGLLPALQLFALVRQCRPDVVLKVFSSYAHYPPGGWQKKGIDAAAACAGQDGVIYVGAVPQDVLARELARAHMLLYPSIYPETAGIVVMEAMAAGLEVVTTDFGALRETLAGFGSLVPMAREAQGGRLALPAAAFVGRALERLALLEAGDESAWGRLHRQVDFAQRNYCWPARAAELEALLLAG